MEDEPIRKELSPLDKIAEQFGGHEGFAKLIAGNLEESASYGQQFDDANTQYREELGKLDDQTLISLANERASEVFPVINNIFQGQSAGSIMGRVSAISETLSLRNLASNDNSEGHKAFGRIILTEVLMNAMADVYGVTGRGIATRMAEVEEHFGTASRIIQQEGDIFGAETRDTYNNLVRETYGRLKKYGPISIPFLRTSSR